MKNLYSYLFIALLLVSCTNDFEELNTDVKRPDSVDPSFILTGIESSLMNQYVFTSNLFQNETGTMAQYFVKHQYTNENIYNFRGSMFDSYWSIPYTQIFRLRQTADIVENESPYNLVDQAVINNRLAILKILEVWTFTQITDAFGDIPYFDAVAGGENLTPTYDQQEVIYPELLLTLAQAVDLIDEGADAFGTADVILNSDMSGWKRFAASLQLRLGMRIMDANPTLGTSTINEAFANGVIRSNDENITFMFPKDTHQSPLRRNNGEASWDDVVICKTYTDIVNDRNDPRRRHQMYAWGPASEPYRGYPMTDQSFIQLGEGRWDWAFLGWNFRYADERGDGWPHVLIDFAEINFLKAEAVERGILAGDAGQLYHDGIRASLEYWGATEIEITTYLAEANVAYDLQVGKTWQEKIGIQKYIAAFPQSAQAWAELRRLNFPKLVAPIKEGQPLPEADIPVRMPYPNNEVILNATNTAAAINAIGGANSMNVKVWWDID
ncbi:MAG: SusD/RagB family nutrient-binding outer membrane lipoprotein [Flammeovirgaceae bacterium]